MIISLFMQKTPENVEELHAARGRLHAGRDGYPSGQPAHEAREKQQHLRIPNS
jgi:hypothetical protein